MIEKSLQKGDLVYVPSDVTMCKFDKNVVAYKYLKTEVPKSVLLVGENVLDKWYPVLYNGEQWYVEERNLFELNGA